MNIAPLVAVVSPGGLPLSDALRSFLARLQCDQGLTSLMDRPGVQVIGAAAAPHVPLADGEGMIWGHVFDRVSWQRVAKPSQMRGSGGAIDAFSERYWGGYLRLCVSEGQFEIARDPSGAVPCYHASIAGAEIFTTRPALLFDAGLLQPEIDWTILTQAIAYRDLRPARTALRGVSELMPGMTATITPDGVATRCFWSPWRFTRPCEPLSLEDAAEQVRRVAGSCISAWAACFERPLVEVSGGLDSSIVAAGVAARHKQVDCVTFASAHGDPDESPYAQAMASHLGVPLHVLRADIAQIDLLQSQARDLPRPAARAFAQSLDLQLRETAARLGSDAFFSGGGGDNVFCFLQSVLPAIDRLRQEGPGTGLFETIGDVATLGQVSIWETARRTLQRALRRRPPFAWGFAPGWLSRDAATALPFPAGHPWLDAPHDVLPGKRVHGHSLITIQNHLEGFDRLTQAPVISPLLSQPLVEACMAIPSWLWCAGGENRAVARRAFATRLPPAVRARQSKGAFDSYCATIFEANRRMLTVMLLEGELARNGILDTRAIEATLDSASVSRHDMLSLLGLVDAEAWAMAWTSRRALPRAS